MAHMDDDQIMLFGDEIAPLTIHETLPHAEHNAAIDLAVRTVLATVVKGPPDQVALIEALAAELGGLKKMSPIKS